METLDEFILGESLGEGTYSEVRVGMKQEGEDTVEYALKIFKSRVLVESQL